MLVTVREGGVEDAKLISDLAIRTFYETYSWYNTTENMRDYTQTHFDPEQTRKELLESETIFLIAVAEGNAIGYAKLRNQEHPAELKGKSYVEIERIYVEQRYQQHKVGYTLIQKCIDKAREKDLDTIWLGVWEKNTKALAFYEKVGFKKFGSHNFQLGEDIQLDHLIKHELK